MIQISGLKKQFGKLEVLKGIDLTLNTGNVTAIVGHNGSGKTTLIKAILGLVRADSGEIFVDDTRVNGDVRYKSEIGYMPQIARFPENLTVAEIITLIKDLREEESTTDDFLYDAFDLAKEADKPLRTLSGGTRQKVSAVIAFLFHPKILILDEPTAGLDPLSSSILQDKILEERRNGKTIILTSHIMSEIEALADELVYLQDGEIFYNGHLKSMLRNTGEKKLERAIARLIEGAAA